MKRRSLFFVPLVLGLSVVFATPAGGLTGVAPATHDGTKLNLRQLIQSWRDATPWDQSAVWPLDPAEPRESVNVEKDLAFPCGVVYHVAYTETSGRISTIRSVTLKYRPADVTIRDMWYSRQNSGAYVQFTLVYSRGGYQTTEIANLYP